MENTPNFKHGLLGLYQGCRKKLGAKIQFFFCREPPKALGKVPLCLEPGLGLLAKCPVIIVQESKCPVLKLREEKQFRKVKMTFSFVWLHAVEAKARAGLKDSSYRPRNT
jgi:hypothetical protein